MTKTARKMVAGGVAAAAALGIGLFTHNAPTQAASPSTAPVPVTAIVTGTASWVSPPGHPAPGLTYEGNPIQGVLDVRPMPTMTPLVLGPGTFSGPEMVLITPETHIRWAPRPGNLQVGVLLTMVATVTGTSVAGHMMVAASVSLTVRQSPPAPWRPTPPPYNHP